MTESQDVQQLTEQLAAALERLREVENKVSGLEARVVAQEGRNTFVCSMSSALQLNSQQQHDSIMCSQGGAASEGHEEPAAVQTPLPGTGTRPEPAPPSTPRTWQLLWSDEFDGIELDRSKWEPQFGTGSQYGIVGWGNHEEQWYTDLPQNLRVEAGQLVIQAVYDPATAAVPNQLYTSARIRTFGKFAVGPSASFPTVKIEARIKVPCGLGLWPAFWMLPSDGANDLCSGRGRYGGWAASGEVDIMETCNDAKRMVASLHYGGAWPHNALSYSDYRLPGGASFADEFHTYAIEWEQHQIRWYVDGVQYAVQNSGDGTKDGWFSLGPEAASPDAPPLPGHAPFGTQQFHLILNLALGAEQTEFTQVDKVPITTEQLQETLAAPKQMLVQWVRVYGSKSS